MSKKLFSDHEPDPLIRELDGDILWEYRPMDPSDTRGPYSSLAPFKAAERLRAMTWQPIDTAPKDGTPFLATLCWMVIPDHDPPQIEIIEWDPEKKKWFCANGGWLKKNLLWPVSWMPLPKPDMERGVLRKANVSRETQEKT